MARVLAALPLLFASVEAIGGAYTDKTYKKAIEGKNGILFLMAPW